MTDKKCDNCGVSHGPDDMFCENCGYDFITGSLPPDGEQSFGAPAPATGPSPAAEPEAPVEPEVAAPAADITLDATPPAAPSLLDVDGAGATAPAESADPTVPFGTEVPRVRISVSVSRAFFDEVVNDGEIDFPDPAPADQELALAGSELHIGRTSESRAIHPDIDVADLTGDQAVSSRHAVLRVAGDATYAIVDVGSTNGTFIDAPDSEAIAQGVTIEVKAGVPIFVGAWTCLTILD